MSETKQVTFVESAQLFNEMVMEKYFKDSNTDNMMIMIVGNAKDKILHGAMCGNRCYLEQALYGACKDDNDVERVIMSVAARISMENLMDKFGDHIADMEQEEPEDEEDDD